VLRVAAAALHPPHLFDYLNSEAFQGDDAAGMVGEEADGVEAEVGQDLGADAVFVLQEALALRALVMAELAIVGNQAGGLAVIQRQPESGPLSCR